MKMVCLFLKLQLLSVLLIIEIMFLLVSGLVSGVIAAGIAILPYLLGGDIQIPLFATSGLLLLLTVVGLSAGLLSMRQLLKAVPIAVLRGE